MINIILHTGLSIVIGFLFVRRLVPDSLMRFVSSIVIGFMLTTTFIYLLAVVLPDHNPQTSFRILVIFLIPILAVYLRSRKTPEIRADTVSRIDFIAVFAALLAATYIMFKSFRQGVGSTVLIGSNEVFDFGHLLGIVRSFSFGSNIPYYSPFVAGAVDPYHFLFYFWVGLWGRFGMPIVWAVNVPSIIGFTAFLITAYRMPVVLFNFSQKIGLLTMALSLSHPTLTFLYYIINEGVSGDLPGKIWHLAKYPYAAPYDGSDISIFQTLNVFTNQRHLAFALASAFIIFFLAKYYFSLAGKNKRPELPFLFGLISGILFGWHVVAGLIAFMTVAVYFVSQKKFRETAIYLSGVIISGWYFLLSWFAAARVYLPAGISSEMFLIGRDRSFDQLISPLINNYGIYLILVPLGFIQLPKQKRQMLVPAIWVFGVAGFVNLVIGLDIIQKFFNYLTVFTGMLVSLAVSKFVKSGFLGKALAVVSGIFLFGSGIVDLMVIKNDFAYPVIDAPDNRLIQAVKDRTPPDAVILSYADIFDPVVLAGRKNYWGFFKNKLVTDRSGKVKAIFEQPQTMIEMGIGSEIDYLIIPLYPKDDFRYTVDMVKFVSYRKLFEDGNFILYKLAE